MSRKTTNNASKLSALGFPDLPPDIDAYPSQSMTIPSSFLQYSEEIDIDEKLPTKTVRSRGTPDVFRSRSVATFAALGLDERLLEGLHSSMGFDRPSEIQAETLPLICKPPYPSLIAQAQNGSGKTCCFALCILSRIDENVRATQALVLVPTRELAVQNAEVIKKMGVCTRCTVISTQEFDQINQARSRVDAMVVVGTMGSLHLWRKDGWLRFDRLKVVVLDEADIMISQESFGADSVLMMLTIDREAQNDGAMPKPQLLLFSATYEDAIRKYVNTLFSTIKRRDVHMIYLPTEELSLDNIHVANVRCYGDYDKLSIIRNHILPACQSGKIIIFVRSRAAARSLHETLIRSGWSVTAIAGDMDFEDRDRVISEFRHSVTSILISTDVLSRGFDDCNVTVVINFDIPKKYGTLEPAYETYLHRVGRSGRFSRQGVAFNLMNMNRDQGVDVTVMNQIAKHFDRPIEELDVLNDRSLEAFIRKATR